MNLQNNFQTEAVQHPRVRSVLLVEDDVTLTPIWEQIVKNLDCNCSLEWVTTEHAARKALWKKQADGEYYDIVICDIFLSGSRTGIDLWRAFRLDPTHFVFVSGVSRRKFEKLFERENVGQHFIAKPLNPIACIQTLNEVIREHAALFCE